MIVMKDINKSFSEKKVLDNISIHIAKGEKVGVIGLNGAGKTTLLKVMSGVLKPESGFLRIDKEEKIFGNYKILKKLAYVSSEKSQLWDELTIKSSYDNCIKMYGKDKEKAKEELKKLNEIFEIEEFLNQNPRDLSLGQRMRCELVYALLSEPQLLMLDEAMIGLDVSIKQKIMDFFIKYREEKNTTIIYTSHNLLEVERICERIILIDDGSIIYDGSVENIMKEYSPKYHLELKIVDNLPDFDDVPLEKFEVENNILRVTYDKQKIETATLLKYIMNKTKIEDIRLFEPDLEGTIKKIYQKKYQMEE